MARFIYQDKNGEDDGYNMEGSVYVSKDNLTFNISVTHGDGDGDLYVAYIPNHRAALLQLANQILDALDATDGTPEGYDGFSTNFASATSTADSDEYSEAGMIHSF